VPVISKSSSREISGATPSIAMVPGGPVQTGRVTPRLTVHHHIPASESAPHTWQTPCIQLGSWVLAIGQDVLRNYARRQRIHQSPTGPALNTAPSERYSPRSSISLRHATCLPSRPIAVPPILYAPPRVTGFAAGLQVNRANCIAYDHGPPSGQAVRHQEYNFVALRLCSKSAHGSTVCQPLRPA